MKYQLEGGEHKDVIISLFIASAIREENEIKVISARKKKVKLLFADDMILYTEFKESPKESTKK